MLTSTAETYNGGIRIENFYCRPRRARAHTHTHTHTREVSGQNFLSFLLSITQHPGCGETFRTQSDRPWGPPSLL